jgi:Tol biopolymer transport system component
VRIAAVVIVALAVAGLAQGATSGTRVKIFEIRIDGKGRRAVLDNPNVNPYINDVSRDGKHILFLDASGLPDGLYVANIDGSHRKRIASVEDDITVPVFSPDARKVAFQGSPFDDCNDPGRCSRVWVVNSDGTGLRVFANEAVKPSFSPDSKKLAYLGRYVYDGQYGALTVANVRGPHRAREFGPESNVNERSRFVWSPRGDRLAVTGDFDEIRVYRVSGPGGTQTPNRFPGNSPSWSPDGTRIAFHTKRYPRALFVARADGSHRRWLLAGSSPVWSPDGRWIAFLDGRCTQIYVIRPARRSRRQVTHERCGAEYGIFWAPDSRRLIYASSRFN